MKFDRQIKILGLEMRLEFMVIVGLLGLTLYAVTIYSCAKVPVKEGLKMMGAEISHVMGSDVSDSWTNKQKSHKLNQEDKLPWNVIGSESSELVPASENMNFFHKTVFSTECCPSNFTSNGGPGIIGKGCACMNKEQHDYLNKRGGNRANQDTY